MNTAYRVWDGERMHYWDDEGLSLGIIGTQWVLWRNDRYGFQNCITGSHEEGSVLMWGTGLKDKNGREIYNYALVDFLGRKYTVCYFEGYYALTLDSSNIDCIPLHNGIKTEVIGDIFQNPELLEGAE
ncbi:YopX family protein [Bacillus subtilis]|uniref:YopX family protein n=1 Tax=Bacillus subtilis TaxID=1423 RepID=UPI002DBFD38E|nr:YopX family protein [Bacillus subtilis]MEC1878368.1 YopX family protein [Bacillus subtilis]MEC1936637.1 YopX family protein [Bacillus subtilis]